MYEGSWEPSELPHEVPTQILFAVKKKQNNLLIRILLLIWEPEAIDS